MTAKRKPGPDAAPASMLVPEKLATLVHYLRREKVILDSDLAELYGVTTGTLNQAVQRNIERFPVDFMFQLSDAELDGLRCQTGISNSDPNVLKSQIVIAKNAESPLPFQSGRANARGGRRSLPYAFTEQGVAMPSSVLRSARAVEVNIAIMRTFVQLRRLMDSNALLAEKIEALEEKYADHDQQFQLVFEAIKQLIAARACPGIAKRRRTSSQRTRLPHHPIRTFRQKKETLTSTMRIPPTATSRPNLRPARIVVGRSWLADRSAHGDRLTIDEFRLLIFELTKRPSSPNQKSKINNPQSAISPSSAIGQASGTRIDRDSLAEQATASSPNYPISNLQCLFLSPIRREFQLPANRAFIG